MRGAQCLIFITAFLMLSGMAFADPSTFEDGLEASKRSDHATAARIWSPLAAKGDIKAQLMLGSAYRYGLGVPKNYTEAAKWYRKSADQGCAYGQIALAELYEQGDGVPKSDVEAAKWLRKAADQGNVKAQEAIGSKYRFGIGVPQNMVLAHMWLNLAASDKETFAGEMAADGRDLIQSIMTAAQIAEAQRLAVEWKRTEGVVCAWFDQ